MELTEAQIQQVVDWVNKKLPGGWKCSFCGERKGWKIDPTIYKRQEFDDEYKFFENQKEIALVVISCSNCGHQFSMDPVTIGVRK